MSHWSDGQVFGFIFIIVPLISFVLMAVVDGVRDYFYSRKG